MFTLYGLVVLCLTVEVGTAHTSTAPYHDFYIILERDTATRTWCNRDHVKAAVPSLYLIGYVTHEASL